MLCPHFRGIQHVVEVLVGQKQGIHLHAGRVQPVRHALGCIHEDGAAGQPQKVTIRRRDSAGVGFDLHICHGLRNAGNRWTIQDGKDRIPRKTEPAAR